MFKNSFFIILIGLFLVLSGCAPDQYTIEKEYWKVNKAAEKIFKNPYASPPAELEKTVNLLNNFIQKYPQNNLSVNTEFNIARLYMVKKEYDKARTQLKTIIDKHSKSGVICAEAVFFIGNSYQLQDKWSLALNEYKKLMLEYPITPRGIDIPIYIAQYYKVKFEPDKMLAALRDAIEHYRALVEKYPDSVLGLTASNLVAKCYTEMKDWQAAINSFNAIIEKYKGKVNLDIVLMNIALIYKNELKDKIKAKEALEQLIKDYPKSRFINNATALVKEMEKK